MAPEGILSRFPALALCMAKHLGARLALKFNTLVVSTDPAGNVIPGSAVGQVCNFRM